MNTTKYISKSYIVLISALTALMFLFSPVYGDDAMHILRWRTIMESNNNDYLCSLFDYFVYHINFDSPRFFNSLLPIFLVGIPKWIMDILMGCVLCFTIILFCKLTHISNLQVLRLSVLTFLLVIFLPWDDGMITISYAVNYIWSLPLILLFMLCFFGKTANCHPIIIILIGLITGWNHEAESLSILIGVICWCILNKKALNKHQLYLVIPLTIILSALLIISILGRFNNLIFFDLSLKNSLYIIVTKMPLTTATIVLTVFVALFPNWRQKLKRLRNTTFSFTFIAMIAAASIGTKYFFKGDRLFCFPEFLAILSIFAMLHELQPTPIIKRIKISYIIASFISFFTIAHLVTANFYIHKIGKQIEAINDNYISGKSPNIFHELTHPSQTPLLAWNKLGITTTYTNTVRWYWQCHLNNNNNTSIDFPIPIEIKNVSFDKITKIPGDNPYYSFNDMLVRPYGNDAPKPIEDKNDYFNYRKLKDRRTITYSLGARRGTELNLIHFIANDYTHWLYAIDETTDAQSRFCDIIEINP